MIKKYILRALLVRNLTVAMINAAEVFFRLLLVKIRFWT